LTELPKSLGGSRQHSTSLSYSSLFLVFNFFQFGASRSPLLRCMLPPRELAVARPRCLLGPSCSIVMFVSGTGYRPDDVRGGSNHFPLPPIAPTQPFPFVDRSGQGSFTSRLFSLCLVAFFPMIGVHLSPFPSRFFESL